MEGVSFFPSIKSYLIQRKYSYKSGGKGVKTRNKGDKWLAVRSEKDGTAERKLRTCEDVQMFVKLSTWKCLCDVYGTLS